MNSVNMVMHKISQETVHKLKSMGADASDSACRSKENLDAALSCSKAAGAYMGALERRFKLKKRPVCN